MKIHFIRHATFILEIDSIKFLVDPMLSEKGAMDPVKGCRNVTRIPMVELPIDEPELTTLLKDIDAIVITHTHRDHWDARSQRILEKTIPVICQPSDTEILQEQGFKNLLPVNNSIAFKNNKIHRTGGQHGTGDIGLRMGHVSGFVIESNNEKIYIAGDTIWCTEVEHALEIHKPDYIVLNSGAAQFDEGDPITMTAEDVSKVISLAPRAKVIPVHMETVNHCWLTRNDLKVFLAGKNQLQHCFIPNDGEKIILRNI